MPRLELSDDAGRGMRRYAQTAGPPGRVLRIRRCFLKATTVLLSASLPLRLRILLTLADIPSAAKRPTAMYQKEAPSVHLARTRMYPEPLSAMFLLLIPRSAVCSVQYYCVSTIDFPLCTLLW